MLRYSEEIKRVKPSPLEFESMQVLIELLKKETDLNIPDLIKRLTLNIGYETSKQIDILSALGFIYSYSDLNNLVQDVLNGYYQKIDRPMYKY